MKIAHILTEIQKLSLSMHTIFINVPTNVGSILSSLRPELFKTNISFDSTFKVMEVMAL